MTLFSDSQTAYVVFGELFRILSQDEAFTARLQESNLSVRLVHTNPAAVIHVSADGVLFGDDVPEAATIIIKMSCATAHELWNGSLLMPAALAMGKVRIKGKIARVLELVPILQPAFDRYPGIAAAHGIVGDSNGPDRSTKGIPA